MMERRLTKYTIAEVKDICRRRGIRCLSLEYRGRHEPLNCKCMVCDHQWHPRFGKVQAGQGCPKCAIKKSAEKKIVAPEQMKEAFRLLKLDVIRELSPRGRQRIFEFQCIKCKNTFAANPHSKLHSKTGCKKCAMKLVGEKLSLSLDELDARLAKKGVVRLGEFISVHKSTSMKYISCGHILKMTPNSVFRAQSCPKCAGHVKITTREYREFAKQFDGKLLMQADSVDKKSLWQCVMGHEFYGSYSGMKYHNRFCTRCFSSHSEEVARTLSEHLLGVPFPKKKIRQIRGDQRYPLELDMYNEDLKLAIEHHGEQHYKPQKNWGGEEKLKEIQQRDDERRLGCAKIGIELLEVRSLGDFTSLEEFRDQLRSMCEKLRITLPAGFETADLARISRQYATPTRARLHEELKSAARSRSYMLLEKYYKGSKEMHTFRCPRGHKVTIQANKFLSGRGCTKCPKVAHNKVAVRILGVGEFDSIRSAAKFLGVRDSTLCQALKEGRQCGGKLAVKV